MKPNKEGVWRNRETGLVLHVKIGEKGELVFDLAPYWAPLDSTMMEGPWEFVAEKGVRIRNIYFWHGSNEKLFKKLSEFCYIYGKHLFFVGGLDEFEKKYQDKFIVLGENLWVTQHANFGQR